MNIDIDKAVADIAWAIEDGHLACDSDAQRQEIRRILMKHVIHNELDEQLPEPL